MKRVEPWTNRPTYSTPGKQFIPQPWKKFTHYRMTRPLLVLTSPDWKSKDFVTHPFFKFGELFSFDLFLLWFCTQVFTHCFEHVLHWIRFRISAWDRHQFSISMIPSWFSNAWILTRIIDLRNSLVALLDFWNVLTKFASINEEKNCPVMCSYSLNNCY